MSYKNNDVKVATTSK